MHLESEEHDLDEQEEIHTHAGERLEFRSVGIDIGSSTSHLMFSRLVLARRGREYFSGYTVIEREIVYRSPVILTPFIEHNTLVNAAQLTEFIQRAYSEAGLNPGQIDTGAVITTGEAAKKENTAAIINLLAGDAGRFVCAAAGPNLEALLAAHGSGAVKESLKHKGGRHETVLNIDIGGGTSKLALVKEGRVVETCAINVGSRLVAWNTEGILTRVEEPGERIAASLGIKARIGKSLTDDEKAGLAEKLAALLFEVVQQKTLSPLAHSLMITPAMEYRGPIDLVVYSGGVAEFIYGEEEGEFGDLGPWVGRSIRSRHARWGVTTGVPAERIRATVIGASQYTVQVSGNTIFLSDPDVLPMHNLPVIKLPPLANPIRREGVADAVRKSFRLLDLTGGKEKVALAVAWDQDPDYGRLREFAEGVMMAIQGLQSPDDPVVLVFDHDVGKLVGHILSDLGMRSVVSIDNINVGQLSYIDIGQLLSTTHAVPVTVKSLIFR